MIIETVVRQLQASQGWTREFIDALAPYYLATLTHMSRGNVTPVYQVIDEIWHAHILCTRDYADFCASEFGHFIHHERTDGVPVEVKPTDFLREYGLSVADLESICANHFAKAGLAVASCGTGNPPSEAIAVVTAGQPGLASCTSPYGPPPEISSRLAPSGADTHRSGSAAEARLARVRCGSPSPPSQPALLASLSVATCGQPDQPDGKPGTGRP